MKKILFVALGLSMACNSSQKTISQQIEPVINSVDPMVYAQSITEAELKEHLYTYASDEFEGRDTGEPGQKLAVEYLKAEYVELGIPAAQSDGNYFQNVPLVISKLPKGSVTINGKEYENGEGLLTFTAATGSYDNIVYVNYGIEEEDYSDYANVDVKGKIVLVKAGEPMNEDGTYALSGSNEASVWSNMSESIGKRMELASNKGAIGVMYFDEANYGRFKNRFNFMQRQDGGSMGLKDEVQNDFFSFFIDSMVANAILPNILSENTSTNVSVKLMLNIKRDSKAVESE
ncbi:unnamed protein product, partial [Scytosiphon promiscuus]